MNSRERAVWRLIYNFAIPLNDQFISPPPTLQNLQITNSLGILGARANAECLEDRLGIMVGDGKAAFGRRRSADAANREAYEEYSRHYCSGDGGHAGGRART